MLCAIVDWFDFDTIKKLFGKNQKPVTVQEAKKLAKNIGAVKYVECSALTQKGLKNVIEEAAKIALKVKHNIIGV